MAGTDTKQLLLQVDASVELLRKGMVEGGAAVDKFDREARRTLDRFDGRMNKVGAGGMPALERGIAGVRSSLSGLVAGLGLLSAGAAGTAFLSLADQAKAMRAQLTLATAEFGTFAQGQADVERIAAATRIGLEASTKLYGNFVRASQPLGKTQAEAARATETFAKALKIGGAGAEEASAATLQFSQALASGVLRGDEFNSIAEASPRVLKLFADALGVPQGQLRALAQEGALTSDKLYAALTDKKITASVDAEFKQLPVTFAESMTLVHDAAVTAFGAFDRGGGFSDAIAHFVGDGADGFASLADRAEAAGVDIRATFAGLRDVFAPLTSGGDVAFDLLGIRIQSARDQIASLLRSFDQVYNAYANADNFGTRIENAVKRGFNRAIDRAGGGEHFQETPLIQLRDSAGDFLRGDRRSRARSRYEASARRLQDLGYIVPRNADGSVDEAGIRRRPTAPPRRTAPPAASSGTGKGRSVGRARAPKAEQPFKLDPIDSKDLDFLSPRGVREAAQKFAREQNEAFTAIFGSDDPLALIVDGAKQAQIKAVDDWSRDHGMDKGLSPLEEYREHLRDTVADTNAALQGVAIDGLQSLEDGLLGVITGTESVGDAFKRMADGIVADLARIAIRKAIVAALDAAIPGAGTFLGLKGKAGGGRIEGRAIGGRIVGPGTGTSDSILALVDGRRPLLVSNGEYVMTAAATKRFEPVLAAMNRGVPGLAAGGPIGAPSISSIRQAAVPNLANLGGGRRERVAVDVNVKTEPSPLFVQTVQQTTIRTVASAAEPIMAGAEARTIARLQRPTLPGGFG